MATNRRIYVLLEGADNTGKTTIAGLLAKRLDLAVYHGPVPPKEAVDEWYGHRWKQAARDSTQKKGLVMDRFHISDYAYNGVFGNETLSSRAYSAFDGMLADLGCKLVYFYDDPVAVHGRLAEEGKDSLTYDQVATIMQRYEQAYDSTRIGVRTRCRLTDLGGIMRISGRTAEFTPEQGFESLVEWVARPTGPGASANVALFQDFALSRKRETGEGLR